MFLAHLIGIKRFRKLSCVTSQASVFSCSSSSTSKRTKRRRARAVELPTELTTVVGEEASEGAGPPVGPLEGDKPVGLIEGAQSSEQPPAESQSQPPLGPAVAVPQVPSPPSRMLKRPRTQVGGGLETAGIGIEEASTSEATDRIAVVLTPSFY